MEQRGQVLDLVAAHPELAEPPAVHRDAVRRAVVVDAEQGGEAAEADRLDVDRARVERELLDIGERVKRCIPGERALWGSSTFQVSGVIAGSSIQALGNASATLA